MTHKCNRQRDGWTDILVASAVHGAAKNQHSTKSGCHRSCLMSNSFTKLLQLLLHNISCVVWN